jgi:hypothetical protein
MKASHPESAAKTFPTTLVTLGAIALAVLGGVFILRAHRQTIAQSGPALIEDYAANLAITNVKTSQSFSTTGDRIITLEGLISNHGPATVTGITVSVVFDNDNDADLETHTSPVFLVRSRKSRVETEPVSAAPIAPHTGREFHLSFEHVGENWNQQQPEIHVFDIQTR